MAKKYASEMVLTVPRLQILDHLNRSGLLPPNEELLATLRRATLTRRDEAEGNPDLVQLVSYFVVMKGDRILIHRRTRRQPEQRLTNIYSVGFGGHLGNQDTIALATPDLFAEVAGAPTLTRELSEEVDVRVTSGRTISFLGFLWDDTDLLGLQHLALAYLVPTSTETFTIREPGLIAEARYIERTALASGEINLTTWSRHLVRNFDASLYRTAEE